MQNKISVHEYRWDFILKWADHFLTLGVLYLHIWVRNLALSFSCGGVGFYWAEAQLGGGEGRGAVEKSERLRSEVIMEKKTLMENLTTQYTINNYK